MSKKQSKQTKGYKPRIVVIGGGTGSFTVLTSLKNYGAQLTAIVAMADDGGSTGVLRDEYGVLPPGDIRQCLVALSRAPEVMRKLFAHRYERGGLKGHTFGNIFLSTLEQVSGSFDKAVSLISEVLQIDGVVIPVTLQNVVLEATLTSGKVIRGQNAIDEHDILPDGLVKLSLSPTPRANPNAIKAILEADLVIVGPGSLYSSLMPNLLVSGVSHALRKTKAKKLYIVNLMNKFGHTDGFTVSDYLTVVEESSGIRFDYILCNTKSPPENLVEKYARESEPVHVTEDLILTHRNVIGKNLLASVAPKRIKGDPMKRTLIRHDTEKLGAAIWDILMR